MECHSIIDAKQVIIKESSDSDLSALSTSKGITSPLGATAMPSPHIIERQCPYCQSSSIVEKTSISGSMPNYSPNIWTDSVLIRASPAYAKSPTNHMASNKTPVMTRKVQSEEVNPTQQKEERQVPTPNVTTSDTHEVQKEEQAIQTPVFNVTITSSTYEIQREPTPVFTSTTSATHEAHQHDDDTIVMNVTMCDETATNKIDDPKINSPVVCEDNEEIVLNEPLSEEPTLKCEEFPFEATIGSLPSEEHAFPRSKPSHNRSRSMDLQAQKLNPKRNTYSRHHSGKFHKGNDDSEHSFTASLMEYATQKKLFKGSQASLDSSFSAATQSDGLLPTRSTLSSSDSRSVTPTGIPYSVDDPLYIHNSFKLYLDMKVFDDDEEFKLLLRVSHSVFHS